MDDSVNLTKAITLRGAGVGATIIRDAVQNGQLISINLVAGRLIPTDRD